MKIMSKFAFFALICSVTGLADSSGPAGEAFIFHGTGDASAAVAVSKDMFIVADDENNVLRIYKTSKTNRPVFSYDMTEFLGIEQEYPEADIEGATMIGQGPRFAGNQRIYWITSHGRNKDGKMRPNRYRFFATTIKVEYDNITISPVGEPCKTLMHRLVNTETVGYLGLDKATRFSKDLSKREREKLAPKSRGLNIEALCASADGRTIYIGFRNPRPAGGESRRAKAIVVPLNNPNDVIERAGTPIFGGPILWDLEGLGIRSMEYSHFHKAYFIIAGSFDEGDEFALYRWSGKRERPPLLVRQLSSDGSKFSPEAVVPFEGSGRLLFLSDDGSLHVKVAGPHECLKDEYRKDGTCLNKHLLDPDKKTFRGIWLTP